MQPKRRKSPQKRKDESYQHDRRNRYGENSKSSRKNIARRRAQSHRADRRIIRQTLVAGPHETPQVLDDIQSEVAATPRKRWRKVPDMPLGEVVAEKLANRKRLNADASRRGDTRAAKRREFEQQTSRQAAKSRVAARRVQSWLGAFRDDEIVEIRVDWGGVIRAHRRDIWIDEHNLLRLERILIGIPAVMYLHTRINCEHIRQIVSPKRIRRNATVRRRAVARVRERLELLSDAEIITIRLRSSGVQIRVPRAEVRIEPDDTINLYRGRNARRGVSRFSAEDVRSIHRARPKP